MKTTLCNTEIWPGVIGSICSAGFFPGAIRAALGRSYEKLTGDGKCNCPNHTFMIVECDNQLWIGDTQSPVSKLTPIDEYESDIDAGRRWGLQLDVPKYCSLIQQARASAWWVANVLGNPYDWPAFGRLGLKSVFGDWLPQAAGLEWARWCTEGVMEAYRDGAKYDVYHNNNPTPFTTIKRRYDGILLRMM